MNEEYYEGFGVSANVAQIDIVGSRPYERTPFFEADLPVEEAGRAKKTISRILIALFGFMVAATVSYTILYAFWAMLFPTRTGTIYVSFLSIAAQYGVGLPVALLLAGKRRISPPERQKFGVGRFLLLVFIGYGLMNVLAMMGNRVMDIFGVLFNYSYRNALEDYMPLWAELLIALVLAPVFEELVFRKFLIDRTIRYGEVPAILISGLLFGLYHGNFYQVFYATVIGFLSAYLYIRSGKIYLSMLFHSILNFLGSVAFSWIFDLLGYNTMASLSGKELIAYVEEHWLNYLGIRIINWMVTVWMIVAVILFIVLCRKARINHYLGEIPKKEIFRTSLVNLGAVLCIGYCLTRFFDSLILPPMMKIFREALSLLML